MNRKKTARTPRVKEQSKAEVSEMLNDDRSRYTTQYDHGDWYVPGHTKQVIAAGLANAVALE